MVAELREEHRVLTQAIEVLELLARGGGKRRGRPPKALSGLGGDMPIALKRRGRPPGSKNKPRAEAAAE